MKNFVSIIPFSLMCLMLPFTQSFAGQWKSTTLGGLSTQLYIPDSSYAAGSGRALFINLHGCGQSADDLKTNGNWEKTADKYGAVVAIPTVPNGGVYMGCWDYYGANHTSESRDNRPIIALVNDLKKDQLLNIDSKQIYVTGLSSGGGEAMILGCLRPDIFAGTGLNAAPSIGTSVGEITSTRASVDQVVSTCTKLAGKNVEYLKTQLTSSIYGDNDGFVDKKHNQVNAEAMAKLYGATKKDVLNMSELEGSNNQGEGSVWSDEIGPRVSIIMNKGLGHAWPAGAGAGSTFVNEDSIDYPSYLAEFFFENNRRIDGSTNHDDDNSNGNDNDNENNNDDNGNIDNGNNGNNSDNGGGAPVVVCVEATLTEHILAKRLEWKDYNHWYTKYGNKKFKLYQHADGKWDDTP